VAVKILVAPCAYKGTIAASEMAIVIAAGIREAALTHDWQCEIKLSPVADGGDDTLACLQLASGGELVYRTVSGPVSEMLQAAYLHAGDTAIVELAQASGIAHLAPGQLAPLTAHTFGTGQLIADAISAGAKNLVITLGGSASTDGGTAILSALGARILNSSGCAISGGGALGGISYIDLTEFKAKTAEVNVLIATDVTNPLLGELGAAAVFAPQKGASSTEVIRLEEGLHHFAGCLEDYLGISPQRSLRRVAGAGAAGGAGFGLATALGAQAQFVSGFHWLAEKMNLLEKIAWCDGLVVAEGCLDSQSMNGKATGELLHLARRSGKAVIALPAICRLSASEQKLFNAIFATASLRFSPDGQATGESVRQAAKLISAVFSRS